MAAFSATTFRPMQYRNYRLYWFGYLISNAGHWMQMVAQAWLVLELTGSPAWLGLIGFLRAFPLIGLSLVGGAIADRLPKRNILYTTQAIQVLSALTLGTLTYLGVVQVWHVIALSTVTGATQAFDNPARQSMMPRLVSKEDLHGAISLNAIAFNGASVFGPSLFGLLYPLIGLSGAFFFNAASFIAVFVALTMMDFPPHQPLARKQSMVADMLEGLRYMWDKPIILGLISMAAVSSFFARPYQQFIAVVVRDVLQGEVALAGYLMAAIGVGTVIFMLVVVSLGRISFKGKLMVGAGFGFGLALIGFAWSGSFWLSFLLLVAVGGFNMTWQTTLNTLLQENTVDEMRGRVMSAYTITALAMMPLGQGPMGLTMTAWGPSWALTAGAGIALLFTAYMAFVRVKAIRLLP